MRSSAILLSCLALGACAARPATIAAPPPLVRAPVELDAQERAALALLLRMEDARSLDAALAARMLVHPTAEVRGRAALAVGRIRDRTGTPLLLQALQDTSWEVRERAAFALGEMADSVSPGVAAALIEAALRDVAPVAAEAVAALGQTGLPTGRPAIDSILLHDAAPAPVRHEALLAAWRLPRDTATMRLLAHWIAAPDPETRWRAAYSLARTYAAPALPLLIEHVADTDDRVRANVVRALRAPVADSAGIRERALAAALAAAADSQPHVRINALRVLAAYRESARTTPVLVASLADADENVAFVAAEALGNAADARAADALRRVALDAARSHGLRTISLVSWMRLDAAGASHVAVQWADSAAWLLRLFAVRSLSASPAARSHAGTTFQRLVRDPHHLVAGAALAALDTAADNRIRYIEMLGVAHPFVRAAAARGLGRSATAADLDVLMHAYARATGDSDRSAALAIVNALGRLRAQGVPVDRGFFLRFPQPPADPAIARAIAERIGQPPPSWREPAPRPEQRPLQFYEDIVNRYVAPLLAGAAPPRAVITTPHGEIVLELAAADAPLSVHNFITLIEQGYYRDTRWHRVVPNFVIQDGDPRGDGSGGPGYTIRDEINPLRYLRGALGMAHAGPDTGSAQFFITHSPQPHLDALHTIFGRVVDGMDVADRVVQEDPIFAIRVIR